MKCLGGIAIAAAVSLLLLGASRAEAGEPSERERVSMAESRPLGRWVGNIHQFEGFELITAETGSFSRTTGEHITGQSLYLSAYIEGTDGDYHAGFGHNPQQILIFRTMSGRLVVRFLDWPCAC